MYAPYCAKLGLIIYFKLPARHDGRGKFYILMALQIDEIVGNKVYISGFVEVSEADNVLTIKGFDIDNDDEITHEVDTELMASVPGFGAGSILMYVYKKCKELLCPECGSPTNPE